MFSFKQWIKSLKRWLFGRVTPTIRKSRLELNRVRLQVEPLELRLMPATYYVNEAVSGGAHDGSSWSNAYSDLHAALAQSTPPLVAGDQILVAAGTYNTS